MGKKKNGISITAEGCGRHKLESSTTDVENENAIVQQGGAKDPSTSTIAGIDVTISTTRKDRETDAASRPTATQSKTQTEVTDLQPAQMTRTEPAAQSRDDDDTVQHGETKDPSKSTTAGIDVTISTTRKDRETDAASRPTATQSKTQTEDTNLQPAQLTRTEPQVPASGDVTRAITEDEVIGRTLGILDEMCDFMNDEWSEGVCLNIHRLRPARCMAKELRLLKADIANTPLPANKNAKKRVFAEMKRLSDITTAPQQLIESIIDDGFDLRATRLDELCDLLDGLNSIYPEVECITPPQESSEDGDEEWLGGDPDDPWFAPDQEDDQE